MDFKEQRQNFDEYVIEKLGEKYTGTDFPDKDLTLTYDTYEYDMTEGTPNETGEDPEPTTEAGDNYVNIYVMLPRGGTISMGPVIERKCDADGNLLVEPMKIPYWTHGIIWLSLKMLR